MIPVHRPVIGGAEMANVMAALQAGEVSGSAGRFITEFEQRFAAYCGCKHGIAVSSGSTALHLACVIAGIGLQDEVLVSTLTNIASANAVVQQGGVVVPVDCEFDTWCMDPRQLEKSMSPRVRAIMPVHLYGHPVNMPVVMDFARKHNLAVIEDCAEAHGAMVLNRTVGSFGDMGCFSFYANKVITTGEGGMIVTNDDHLAERARLLRNLAFTRPRFRHRELGFNYRMTNVQAAIGCGQLDRIEEIIEQKRQIASWYTERLRDVSWLQLPVEKSWARNVYWMFCVVCCDNRRDYLEARLRNANVETRTMFCPMELQTSLVERRAVRDVICPVAERLWQTGLYLPSGNDLTEAQVDYICKVITCV